MTNREVGAQMRALGFTLEYDERGRCYIHKPGDPVNRFYIAPGSYKYSAWQRAVARYRRETGI